MKAVHCVLICAATVLAACSSEAPPPEPVRSVKLLQVGAGNLSSTAEYAGDVRARTESALGFRVGGKLLERPVDPGQRVQRGQLLARLDAQDLALSSQAAQAAEAAARTQRDLAAADLKRFQDLLSQGFVSQAEIDRRQATLRSAEATLQQAQAQRAVQGNQAAYARLQADAAGVVVAVLAEPGQVVSAGTPVVRVAIDGPRDVVFAVPEDKVEQITQGSEVAVRGWSGGANLTGRVREVAASADAATRTYQIKVAIDGADAPALGSTVYVTPKALSHAGIPAIKLPTSALRQEGQSTAVWVYDAASSTVKSQVVQIATADGNEAVVAAGLAPGMQVVATGVHVLSPGQKVLIYQPKTASAPASKAQTATNPVAMPAAPAATAAAPAASTAN